MIPSTTSSNIDKSALTLANAAQLVSNVIIDIAGNDISNSINGSTITKNIIHSLAFQRIAGKLEEKLKTLS
jgi:hypothetical protein